MKPTVFPACLLAGIHCLEPKDKSWIPEQVRDDGIVGLSGMLTGRNSALLV